MTIPTENSPHRLSRRQFMQALAFSGIRVGFESRNPLSVRSRPTVYGTDKLMEDQIWFRTGLAVWGILDGRNVALCNAILNAQSMGQLKEFPFLLQNEARLNAAMRMNTGLLQALQLTVQGCAIAVNGLHFPSIPRDCIATGQLFELEVFGRVNGVGYVENYRVPEAVPCVCWDVMEERLSEITPREQFVVDVNPTAYGRVFGAYWNDKERRFYTSDHNPVREVPLVELRLPNDESRNTFPNRSERWE